jgi:hypothetical protein
MRKAGGPGRGAWGGNRAARGDAAREDEADGVRLEACATGGYGVRVMESMLRE